MARLPSLIVKWVKGLVLAGMCLYLLMEDTARAIALVAGLAIVKLAERRFAGHRRAGGPSDSWAK